MLLLLQTFHFTPAALGGDTSSSSSSSSSSSAAAAVEDSSLSAETNQTVQLLQLGDGESGALGCSVS